MDSCLYWDVLKEVSSRIGPVKSSAVFTNILVWFHSSTWELKTSFSLGSLKTPKYGKKINEKENGKF